MSAPLFAPRSAVWITFSRLVSHTATSSPRHVGSTPPPHSAGGPNVVLMPRFASGGIAKSYMYFGSRPPGSRVGPGPK